MPLFGILNKVFDIVQLIATKEKAHNALTDGAASRTARPKECIMEKRQPGSTAQAVALTVIETTSPTVIDLIGREA
jgi:hypothetical protein